MSKKIENYNSISLKSRVKLIQMREINESKSLSHDNSHSSNINFPFLNVIKQQNYRQRNK